MDSNLPDNDINQLNNTNNLIIQNQTPNTVNTANTIETPPKKKRTSLIISAIIVILILICGGVLTAFIINKNQPNNIAAEAFANLINAKRVTVTGALNINFKNNSWNPISELNITFDSSTADANQSSNSSISIKPTNNDKTINFDLDEVFIKEGILHVKANGITQLFNDYLKEQLDGSIKQTYKNNLTSSSHYYNACKSLTNYRELLNCYNMADEDIKNDPSFNQTIDTLMEETNTFFDNTLKQIDNQWFEFSINSILKSNLAQRYLNASLQNNLLKIQDCTTQMINDLGQYSNEFANLYSTNQFISLEPADESFYKVSINADALANFLRSAGKTKPFSNFTECNNNNENTLSMKDNYDSFDLYGQINAERIKDENESPLSYYADNIRYIIAELPDIYVKFDGFLTHHLVELKLSETTTDYTFSSDINFSYPPTNTISAPENSQPIMDLVENIVDQATVIYQKSTNMSL